jgi:hypothetical protein
MFLPIFWHRLLQNDEVDVEKNSAHRLPDKMKPSLIAKRVLRGRSIYRRTHP